MHTFPSDVKLKDAWVRHIHRHSFVPNNNSRVCSTHVCDSNFISKRTESNASRRRSTESGVAKRILKVSAYLSISPNQPSYLFTSSTSLPTASAFSVSKEAQKNELVVKKIKQKEQEDEIKCLEDVSQRFDSCNPKPSNFFIRNSKDNKY